MPHEIVIDGETRSVTAVMVTKRGWKAYGDAKGKRISADGSSEQTALSRWIRQAESVGS